MTQARDSGRARNNQTKRTTLPSLEIIMLSALTNRRESLITDFFRPNTPDPIADNSPPPDPIIDLTIPNANEEKETRLTNKNKFHRYRNNPTPRITTLNTTSYTDMPTDKKSFKRQFKITKNLETVSTHSDFVLTQEPKP